MKIIIFYSCLLLSSLTGFGQQKLQEVNALLRDESYITSFGVIPDEATNETERIQTHLSYVEQLLRTADAANLSSNQQANRAAILDWLHQYWNRGIFPANRDYPGERRPCFIDADGNICAVGFLIEQTKGRQLAEDINAKHQYDFLLDMHEPVIKSWADEYGLTLEECAMIQPTYGPPPADQTNYAEIKTSYGISSGLIGGTNIAANIVNLSSRLKHNTVLSYIGLMTGTAQVIMGITNVKRTGNFSQVNGGEIYTSYKAQNNLSYVNIAMGTSTLITSVLNLTLQKKIKDERNAVNVYSYPNYCRSVSMGLSFSRRL